MEVKTIAVIGAGDLGRRIASTVLLAGYKTILEDVSSRALEEASAWIEAVLDAKRGREEGGVNAGDAAARSFSTAATVEAAIHEADLVIETTAEEIELKIELFTILDKFGKPNAIFASTSPTFSITEMAEVTFCAERCIGMRFSESTAETGQVVLARGRETSDETVARCREVGRRLRKEIFVTCEDARGASDFAERKVAGAHD